VQSVFRDDEATSDVIERAGTEAKARVTAELSKIESPYERAVKIRTGALLVLTTAVAVPVAMEVAAIPEVAAALSWVNSSLAPIARVAVPLAAPLLVANEGDIGKLVPIGLAAMAPETAAAEVGVAETESIVLEGSGTASPVAANQSTVALPTPGESKMAYGTRAHQDLPRIIGETNPGAGGRFNVRPGLTGPDLANPTGMNATFGEMKSLWGVQSKMVKQADSWGFDAQSGRYFFYDRDTGAVFEGIIQTEKYSSGRFRP
jgi:hypothetical protein